MPQAYYYSSVAGQFTLTTAATGGATILNVNTTTGMPGSLPFKLVLEPGTVREEIVKVTAIGGLALTVIRGWDGSPATAHDAGTPIRHAMTAEDLTLARIHEAATSGVHGVTSGLVGISDTQTLTNKTLSPANSGTVAAVAKGLSGQSGDLVQAQDYLGNPVFRVSPTGDVTAPNITAKFATYDANVAAFNTHAAAPNGVHGVAGNVVGTSDNQTLTNKTISGSSNTLSNIPQSAVTGLVALAGRAPQKFAATSAFNLPTGIDQGVNFFTAAVGGGTVIDVSVLDSLKFVNAGIVIMHVLYYIPANGNPRAGWIDGKNALMPVGSGVPAGTNGDRFSLTYVKFVSAGQVVDFGWRQDSGITINGCTCTVTGVFIPN